MFEKLGSEVMAVKEAPADRANGHEDQRGAGHLKARGKSGRKFICWLCERKFRSHKVLLKHEKISEMHRRKLAERNNGGRD